MSKIKAGNLETQSSDVVAENLEHIRTLFPEVFVEGRLDFKTLEQILGGGGG